jgi:hypothetical protein
MNKSILNHVHRVQFAAKLLAHTKAHHPPDPLGVNVAKLIQGKLVTPFGKSN